MNWLNSQPWLRPLSGILVSLATGFLGAQHAVGVDHATVAGNIAWGVLAVFGGAGAASLGLSNSKQPPPPATFDAPLPK